MAPGGSEIGNDEQAVVVGGSDFVRAVLRDECAAFRDDLAAADRGEKGEAGGAGDDTVGDGGLLWRGKRCRGGVCEAVEGEEAGGGFAGYGEGVAAPVLAGFEEAGAGLCAGEMVAVDEAGAGGVAVVGNDEGRGGDVCGEGASACGGPCEEHGGRRPEHGVEIEQGIDGFDIGQEGGDAVAFEGRLCCGQEFPAPEAVHVVIDEA